MRRASERENTKGEKSYVDNFPPASPHIQAGRVWMQNAKRFRKNSFLYINKFITIPTLSRMLTKFWRSGPSMCWLRWTAHLHAIRSVTFDFYTLSTLILFIYFVSFSFTFFNFFSHLYCLMPALGERELFRIVLKKYFCSFSAFMSCHSSNFFVFSLSSTSPQSLTVSIIKNNRTESFGANKSFSPCSCSRLTELFVGGGGWLDNMKMKYPG